MILALVASSPVHTLASSPSHCHLLRAGRPHHASRAPAGKKTGFGSHDATKRDEFLNLARSKQYSEQLRSESRAAMRRRSPLAGAGNNITNTRPRRGEASVTPGMPVSPMDTSARPSLRDTLAASLASLTKTRSFTPRRGFDQAYDLRSPREVYGIRERASPKGKLETGSFSRTSQEVGHGASTLGKRLSAPEARKVSVVREFYRSNGGQ